MPEGAEVLIAGADQQHPFLLGEGLALVPWHLVECCVGDGDAEGVLAYWLLVVSHQRLCVLAVCSLVL